MSSQHTETQVSRIETIKSGFRDVFFNAPINAIVCYTLLRVADGAKDAFIPDHTQMALLFLGALVTSGGFGLRTLSILTRGLSNVYTGTLEFWAEQKNK